MFKKLFFLFFLFGLNLGFSQIQANNDNFGPITSGSPTPSVVSNDILSGMPVVIGSYPGEVTVFGLSVPAGFTFVESAGVIVISNDVRSGIYTLEYQICENDATPSDCDTAMVRIEVLNPIDAANDILDPLNAGYTSVESVTVNDILDENPVVIGYAPGQVSLNLEGSIPSFLKFYPENGKISADPSAPDGIYIVEYMICENGAVPANCDSAKVTVMVNVNGLFLRAFIDSNSNNIKDSWESYFSTGKFSIDKNNTGNPIFVEATNGYYYIRENNINNLYDLNFIVDNAYTSNFIFTGTALDNLSYNVGSGKQVVDFPIQVVSPFSDLFVGLSPIDLPRPGFSYANRIIYRNEGNQTIASGTITFVKDIKSIMSSASQAGITNTPTGFTYNFTNLLPNQTRFIDVAILVPVIPTVSLGEIFTNSVFATNLSSDLILTNNQHDLSQAIVGAYDPNVKTESHGNEIKFSSFTSNDYLTYTIQFENTGTASAQKVRISDVLDAKLDETTIKQVSASHPLTFIRSGNNLEWIFDPIDLPPSVSNTNIGKGYVVFQVKPKSGYALNDIIPNTASIYFDFNPAIVTNTCTTKFTETLDNDQFSKNSFSIYPVPVKDILTIETAINETKEVVINDLLGKTIYSQKFTANETKMDINLSFLKRGIYFVKISLPSNLQQQMKLLKE